MSTLVEADQATQKQTSVWFMWALVRHVSWLYLKQNGELWFVSIFFHRKRHCMVPCHAINQEEMPIEIGSL